MSSCIVQYLVTVVQAPGYLRQRLDIKVDQTGSREESVMDFLLFRRASQRGKGSVIAAEAHRLIVTGERSDPDSARQGS